MWRWIMFFGFIIAVTPSMFYGVWNGLSMFGLMLCFLSAGFILREEMDK